LARAEGGAVERFGVERGFESVDDGCLVSGKALPLDSMLILVSVPISKLPTLVRETSEDMERRGITACHFGYDVYLLR